MRKHSAMAVRVTENGQWVAWDLFISRYPFDTNLVHGHTREDAIANYRNIYYPEKPSVIDDIGQLCRDSAKYRRIVEKFRELRALNQPNHVPTAMGVMQEVREIMAGDFSPTHCDKCNQELK